MKSIINTVALVSIQLVVMCASLAASERPNLLFILTDDQRDDSFSAMGHPWVETPNIDALLLKGCVLRMPTSLSLPVAPAVRRCCLVVLSE